MPCDFPLDVIADALCVAVCLVATVTDARGRRIPNWLTLPAVAVGLLLNFALVSFDSGVMSGLKAGLLPSLIGSTVLFLVFLGLNAIGAMGMGDVKLMAAVGAFIRWPVALWGLAYVLISGAVLSVVWAVARGQIREVLRNMRIGLAGIFKRAHGRKKIELHHMPYAYAILAGVTWCVLSRYFEFFRI